jgi:hypothetical protein
MLYFIVMAGLVPAIHVFGSVVPKTWMPGTRPGMTAGQRCRRIYARPTSCCALARWPKLCTGAHIRKR